LASLESEIPVSAGNMPEGGQQEGTLRPSGQSYCSIRVHVHQGDGRESFPLSLLLDTACSGIVLRPSTVAKHKLPVVTSPVTMTSAGGTSTGNSQVATVESFTLEGTSNRRRFGPLPAALQDMGALPPSLDGIIGLSFLNQFDSVEFNFVDGIISLYDNDTPVPPDHWIKVAEGEMHMLGSLGIYAVDTWWGGRGPVRMLVDTGAATSYWSWSGVTKDLQIPPDSPTVQRLPSSMGVMGSDNQASALTHRIYVSSRMGLPDGSGLDLSNGRIAVDIGDIPILEQLETLGVGGILGLDLMRRCSAVRVRCQGIKPYLEFYESAPVS
jgi:predicted aspartyl protease